MRGIWVIRFRISSLLFRRFGTGISSSETAHNPPNSKVWHDTYNLAWDERFLYLEFAGETLIDVVLTSFKKVNND
jgi:hypothetical protein